MRLEELDGSRIFLLHDFLSADECAHLVSRSEALGYEPATIGYASGPVLDSSIRNNTRVTLEDPHLAAAWWERTARHLPPIGRATPCRLSERFKFYRYEVGQKFDAHRDGRVRAEPDQMSELTFMVYLNDGVEGGETVFLPAGLRVQPQAGTALVFLHKILHEGAPVISGRKYVLRTDVMYRHANDTSTE